MTRYYVGIDGGASNLRVVIADGELNIVGEGHETTVNPSVVGRRVAGERIQAAVTAALSQSGVTLADIAAAGVGVAGASAEYAADWLREILGPVLPGVPVIPSSDIEIALVGAHAARYGALVLSGTGSVALAIDHAGQSSRAGGWGYLLGDEGSGYWLGIEGLRAATWAADGRGPATALTTRLLEALDLATVQAATLWLYQAERPRTREVAQLAPVVLEVAGQGDRIALDIVGRGAEELARLTRTVISRLEMAGDVPVAFAGGLLTSATPLRDRLCHLLGMKSSPRAAYPPVVGAALLAKLADEAGR
jgi:N-acetylglucosamine kinase-like BadF-type ATPase